MFHYDTHFCLASRQPVSNITPALHGNFKPRYVVLLVSMEVQENAVNLIAVCVKHGIKTSVLNISDAFNIPYIFDIIEHYLKQNSEESIVLNITGGTKPMALCAVPVYHL